MDIQQKVASATTQLVSPKIVPASSFSPSKLQYPSEKKQLFQPHVNQGSSHNSYSNPHGTITTPAVRKLAKENNIDLSKIRGTGPDKRILKEDILMYISSSPTQAFTPITTTSTNTTNSTNPTIAHTASVTQPQFPPRLTPSPPPSPSSSTNSNNSSNSSSGGVQRVPIRGVKRLMVKSMTKALEVPHLTYGEEVEMDNLISLREKLNAVYARRCKLPYFYITLS